MSVWSAGEHGWRSLSGSASGRLSIGERMPAGARTSSGIDGVLSPTRRALAYGPFKGDASLFWVRAGSCWRCCLPSVRLLPRSVSHGTPRLRGRCAPSLVVWSAACGGAECLSTRLVSGEEPWLVRASDRPRPSPINTPYRFVVWSATGSVQSPASGRLRWAMWGVAEAGASRTVAGDSVGCLFESGLGRSPHLGARLDECCWSYASPAGAVRVRSRPCAGTLAPGLREAPDYAPGGSGGWVTSCGWRRPSRPRGEALQIQYRAGSA